MARQEQDQVMSRRQLLRLGALGGAAGVAAVILEACGGTSATGTPGVTAAPTEGIDYDKLAQALLRAQQQAAASGSPVMPGSSPDVVPSKAPVAPVESSAPAELEAGQLARPVPVPDKISGDMARALRKGTMVNGVVLPMFTEGRWMLPASYSTEYNPEAKTDPKVADEVYKPIGPWYPVAVENVDADAATFTTHGNVGELIISSNKGGRAMVAVMVLNKHQHEGAWGTNPITGNFEQNDLWPMQYNFHSLQPYQDIFVIDPDTGKQLTWPDGSDVKYKANKEGTAAFQMFITNGQDQRVGFVFDVQPRDSDQATEIKFERGPNEYTGQNGFPFRPGENPLPSTIMKPMIPNQ